VVDEFLAVPGHPRIFAVGDAAAAPDLTRPGRLTPMTAQHAQRQGGASSSGSAWSSPTTPGWRSPSKPTSTTRTDGRPLDHGRGAASP